MKKICLWVVLIAIVSTLIMIYSSCALKAQDAVNDKRSLNQGITPSTESLNSNNVFLFNEQIVGDVKKSLEKEKIQYSDVVLNGKQIIIELISDSAGRCSEKDVEHLMSVFHSLKNNAYNDSFDEVQTKITDNNGELIYHTIQRVLFSDIQRLPRSTEKIDETCKKIEEQIAKSGTESFCRYNIDTVLDVPRVNFTVTYNSANNQLSFDINELYDLIISDISQNCNIGYCTFRIKKTDSSEDDLYFEGDCDLNLFFAWLSPELSSMIGPPSENQR